ncbi:hypothetical protein SLS62_011125 [Diatrype stigma]|uniref:Uncharacterized protein n=1 Tax=Diatrype stigma TaxID=117547 RepID=A0AAN9YEH0_9PEZI
MYPHNAFLLTAAGIFASSAAAQCISWQLIQYYAAMPDGTIFDGVITPAPITEKSTVDPVCTLKSSNWDDFKTEGGRMFDCTGTWFAMISEDLKSIGVSPPDIEDPWKPNVYQISWDNNEFNEIPFAASTEGQSGC